MAPAFPAHDHDLRFAGALEGEAEPGRGVDAVIGPGRQPQRLEQGGIAAGFKGQAISGFRLQAAQTLPKLLRNIRKPSDVFSRVFSAVDLACLYKRGQSCIKGVSPRI
jgi:hypothetical protein